MREIIINGMRSWHDFGAMLANVDEQYPEIKDVVETVPYGNVEYKFTDLYGSKVLGYRDIVYKFKLWHEDPAILEQRINRFVNFMYELGDNLDIYDSGTTYHYAGRLAAFSKESTVGEEYGARMFACTFRCKQLKQSNGSTGFLPDASWWPDVNDDGVANASDASLILTIAAKIGAGEPLPDWVTADVLKRADANHDGAVSASDASIVLAFAAYVNAKGLENNYLTWYQYLNMRKGYNSGVI